MKICSNQDKLAELLEDQGQLMDNTQFLSAVQELHVIKDMSAEEWRVFQLVIMAMQDVIIAKNQILVEMENSSTIVINVALTAAKLAPIFWIEL